MLALDYDSAKRLALWLVGGFILLSVISAMVIKNIVGKLVSALLMAGLALGAWTQRTELQDCAQRARERAAAGAASDLTCRLFGSDVTIIKAEPAAEE